MSVHIYIYMYIHILTAIITITFILTITIILCMYYTVAIITSGVLIMNTRIYPVMIIIINNLRVGAQVLREVYIHTSRR